ncbi:hypothetical protein ACIGW8_10115 [Streptomyces sioyaensis]|uniref:hypothetical protein n=1 Tax=Streptomyces sioyaensis TaxID=67364 RepID=UPI0037D3A782
MTTDHTSSAKPAPTPTGNSAPKVAARQGVLSALRPDPHTVTVTGLRPGLTVRGLDRDEIPVADWLCVCGHHERARGRAAVHALTHRVQVGQCPHRAPETSRRKVA